MLMTKRIGSIIMTIGLLAGCGRGGINTDNPGTPPPHNGTLVVLPEVSGYMEVVIGNGSGPEIAVYFLKDTKTPFDPAPTSAILKINEKQKIELKPENGGLVTPTGPKLFKNEPTGDVFVEIAGRKLTVPLNLR